MNSSEVMDPDCTDPSFLGYSMGRLKLCAWARRRPWPWREVSPRGQSSTTLPWITAIFHMLLVTPDYYQIELCSPSLAPTPACWGVNPRRRWCSLASGLRDVILRHLGLLQQWFHNVRSRDSSPSGARTPCGSTHFRIILVQQHQQSLQSAGSSRLIIFPCLTIPTIFSTCWGFDLHI